MYKKIFITGGTGFIGSYVVKKLFQLGYDLTVLDNNSRGKANRIKSIIDKIHYIEGDIRNRDLVISSSKSCDLIIHLAYINGTKFFYEKPYEVLDVATKGMNNILDSMEANNIDKMILASSSEVYNQPKKIPTDEKVELFIPDVFNPRFSYGGGKIISELLAINYGAQKNKKIIVFRPHNVYGPDMGNEHIIPELLNKLQPNLDKKIIDLEIQGSGNETRAFIYIDDFVDGLVKLMHEGEFNNIYNIGTEDEVSINTIVSLIAKALDIKINLIPSSLKQGSTNRRCPDITKIKNIGFVPMTSLQDGLAKTISWYIK